MRDASSGIRDAGLEKWDAGYLKIPNRESRIAGHALRNAVTTKGHNHENHTQTNQLKQMKKDKLVLRLITFGLLRRLFVDQFGSHAVAGLSTLVPSQAIVSRSTLTNRGSPVWLAFYAFVELTFIPR